MCLCTFSIFYLFFSKKVNEYAEYSIMIVRNDEREIQNKIVSMDCFKKE